MPFADLLDHTVRIWRQTEVLGPIREVKMVHVPIATVAAAKNRPVGKAGQGAPMGDTGPGLAPIGDSRVYMLAGVDVAERDILQFLTGPDAPEMLEVDSPPTRPRGHHTELVCRYWTGILTPAEES